MRTIAAVLAILLGAKGAAAQATPVADASTIRRLEKLADDFVAARVERDPDLAYAFGVSPGPQGDEKLLDRTPAGRRKFDRIVDRLTAALARIDRRGLSGRQRVLHAVLDEELTASRRMRVCRKELWDVSHFGGALMDVNDLAKAHPVGTPALRLAAVKRWSSMPAFLDQQIANLKEGVAAGYTVPKPVVRRVIAVVDAALKQEVEKSPYYSPAIRDGDPAFAGQMRSIVADKINPALRRYRDFLEREYLPSAGDTLGVSALPNGAACYRALARRYTTIDRSPDEHFAQAEALNRAAVAEVRRIGKARYGIDNVAEIAARARAEPSEKYGSPEEMLADAQAVTAGAEAAFKDYFHSFPTQEVVVGAYPASQQGLGLSPRYFRSGDPAVPARVSYPVEQFARMPRSVIRSAALHETIPGHHFEGARNVGVKQHALLRLSMVTAFVEGWGQYAERLAGELGMRSDTGRVLLSANDGRAVALDAGIHARGWNLAEAGAFFQASGGASQQQEDRIIRTAAFPGTALSYATGEAEIMSLRQEAKSALGDRFDIRDFHEAVLADGPVPLWLLRENVTAWIAREKAKAK